MTEPRDASATDEGPHDEAWLRATVAEALFEARIGIPQDTPILADALIPPMKRLGLLAASATDEHQHRIEYPSTCTGCEHLAAAFVASAPEWMRVAASATDEGPEITDAMLRQQYPPRPLAASATDEPRSDLRAAAQTVVDHHFGTANHYDLDRHECWNALRAALAASALDEGPDECMCGMCTRYRARPAVPALDERPMTQVLCQHGSVVEIRCDCEEPS